MLIACGQDKGTSASVGGKPPPAMLVSVLEMQPTTVPIQAEAVAQTEGAKEVEIRPRVGGIVLKSSFYR